MINKCKDFALRRKCPLRPVIKWRFPLSKRSRLLCAVVIFKGIK